MIIQFHDKINVALIVIQAINATYFKYEVFLILGLNFLSCNNCNGIYSNTIN